jgi:hypothetical protein
VCGVSFASRYAEPANTNQGAGVSDRAPAPVFGWTGFYLGGDIAAAATTNNALWNLTPTLSPAVHSAMLCRPAPSYGVARNRRAVVKKSRIASRRPLSLQIPPRVRSRGPPPSQAGTEPPPARSGLRRAFSLTFRVGLYPLATTRAACWPTSPISFLANAGSGRRRRARGSAATAGPS